MTELECIIEEEAQRVRPMVCSKVAPTDVDDVMQDIRLSFYQALPRFNGKSKLSTYAYVIARRRIADYFRLRYRKKKEISAIEEYVRQPHYEAVESGVSFLTIREEAVLRLIGSGMNNTEIAKALFISINTVRSHLKKIYAKLQCQDRIKLALFSYRFFKEHINEN